MSVGRVMPMGRLKAKELPPAERVKGFIPYVEDYTLDQAVYEASRCLWCHDPPCVVKCPAGIMIPEFLFALASRDLRTAAKILRESNVFAGVCGYVCPVEKLCESACVRKDLDEPVAISMLQRFIYLYEKENGFIAFEKAPATGKKVAVIGAGPAGLAAAYELAKRGHDVTVFDYMEEPGGLLLYGILPYKYDWSVPLTEIEYVRGYGVKIVTGRKIDSLDVLFKEGYQAVFIASGLTKPRKLNVPGEDLEGVFYALDFLAHVAKALRGTGSLPDFKGKRVAVIGGGDTAVDSALTALRLGAERVYIIYRRSLEEMPAVPAGRKQAREEGIEFILLAAPTRIIGENGKVKAIECIRMKLGAPDASGRRRPEPIPGSEFTLDVDVVLVAIGQVPDEEFLSKLGVAIEKGLIKVDEKMQTSREGVFAGGDVVNGGDTVVRAVSDGLKAAQAIDEYLKGR